MPVPLIVPIVAAQAALVGTSGAAAYVFASGCEKGIKMYIDNDCKRTGYLDFVCAMVRTFTISNCMGLAAAASTCVAASAGIVKDAKHAELIKKFLQLNIQTP